MRSPIQIYPEDRNRRSGVQAEGGAGTTLTFFRKTWFHFRRFIADMTGLIEKPPTIHEYAKKHLDDIGCKRYGAGLTYKEAVAKFSDA